MPDFVSGDIPTKSTLLLTPVLTYSLPLLPLAPSKTHHAGSQPAPARAASISGWLLCSKLFALSSQARAHCLGEGDSFVGSARGQVIPEPGTWSRLAPPRDNLCSGHPCQSSGNHSSVQLEQLVIFQSFPSVLREATFAKYFELKILTFWIKKKPKNLTGKVIFSRSHSMSEP